MNIIHLWRTHRARCREINDQLAADDQLIPSQLDRWDQRPFADWTPEALDRLAEMVMEAEYPRVPHGLA